MAKKAKKKDDVSWTIDYDKQVNAEWQPIDGEEAVKPKPKPSKKKAVKRKKKVSTALVPRQGKIVEMEKKPSGIYEVKKREIVNVTPSDYTKPYKSSGPMEGKKSFWSKFTRKDAEKNQRRSKTIKEKASTAKRFGYSGAKYSVHATSRNITRAGGAMQEIGGAVTGIPGASPIRIFSLAWKKLSNALKWTIILVMLLAIFFLPWGIFYYSGWAVAAAFMFLIALIYWIFVNLFNGIAYVVVSGINAIVSIIMGLIILLVEVILGIFTKVGPGPDGTILPDSWMNPETGLWEFYWTNGHELLANTLIPYSMIANVPALMVVEAPPWQDWMYTILAVKMLEYIPGLQGLADGFNEVSKGMTGAFADFVATAPPWQVVIVGALPVIAIASLLIYVWIKNRHYLRY